MHLCLHNDAEHLRMSYRKIPRVSSMRFHSQISGRTVAQVMAFTRLRYGTNHAFKKIVQVATERRLARTSDTLASRMLKLTLAYLSFQADSQGSTVLRALVSSLSARTGPGYLGSSQSHGVCFQLSFCQKESACAISPSCTTTVEFGCSRSSK